MVLFLHNRYRSTGGEERTVEDLVWLVRELVQEPAELLARDSNTLGRTRAAAGLLRGGLQPEEVARAVRLGGARIVHAHNLHPSFGWRALAAARRAGARVVLHLHQYRLVCAIGVCYTRGAECTRCHGRDTLPGVRLNCRGSLPEAAVYGAALSLWQHRMVEQADAVIVPSRYARERLRELGAPLPWDRVHVVPPPVRALSAQPSLPTQPSSMSPPSLVSSASSVSPLSSVSSASTSSVCSVASASSRQPDSGSGGYALVVSRLAPEKGVDVAIDACRTVGIPLVVAGDGPELASLQRLAGSGAGAGAGAGAGRNDVRFVGHVSPAELDRLRAGASVALVPSRSAETFGMAAAEAMACGLPVVASRIGALPELIDETGLAAPGDAHALAQRIASVLADADAGRRGLERVRAICAPEVVARTLAGLYGEVAGDSAGTGVCRHAGTGADEKATET